MEIVSELDILKLTFDEVSSCGCAIGVDFSAGAPAWTHFSYDQEFLNAYGAEDLASRDETLRFGLMSSPGYAVWSDLRAKGDPASFIMAEKFGIAEGVCVSVEVEGVRFVASISREKDDIPSIETINILRRLLVRATNEVKAARSDVSRNTLDYLSAAARGLDSNDSELAECLGLSVHGARSRRKSAIAELNAKSPAHAMNIAVSNGLISTYL